MELLDEEASYEKATKTPNKKEHNKAFVLLTLVGMVLFTCLCMSCFSWLDDFYGWVTLVALSLYCTLLGVGHLTKVLSYDFWDTIRISVFWSTGTVLLVSLILFFTQGPIIIFLFRILVVCFLVALVLGFLLAISLGAIIKVIANQIAKA